MQGGEALGPETSQCQGRSARPLRTSLTLPSRDVVLVFRQLVCVLSILRIEILGSFTVLLIETNWEGNNDRL